LSTSDRILLKNQTGGVENGIYTVNVTGAPTRVDILVGENAAQTALTVINGTVNANTTFVCSNAAGSDIVGTDPLVFVSIGVGGGGSNPGGSSSELQYRLDATTFGGIATTSTDGTDVTFNGGNLNFSDILFNNQK